MSNVSIAVGAIFFIVVIGVVGESDYQDEVRQEQVYCEMVNKYNMTNGEQGWPDYDQIYDRACQKYEFAG